MYFNCACMYMMPNKIAFLLSQSILHSEIMPFFKYQVHQRYTLYKYRIILVL